ncbi:hypothetical protein NFI96_016665 [Prochilodus magdalenae]|nr:hypothetical protein NFI96_016665 [Prochilodus magdalenae]
MCGMTEPPSHEIKECRDEVSDCYGGRCCSCALNCACDWFLLFDGTLPPCNTGTQLANAFGFSISNRHSPPFLSCVSASGMERVISLYGDDIIVPCNNGDNKPSDLIFTKWKYTKDDGTSGDLLVKQAQKDEAKISATDGYKDRISIMPDSSLQITKATLADQRVFTCMVVSMSNLNEYLVKVDVHKRPSAPEIRNKASQLENGKLTPVSVFQTLLFRLASAEKEPLSGNRDRFRVCDPVQPQCRSVLCVRVRLGECVTIDANPPAEVIWLKNDKTLVNDDKTIIISKEDIVDPTTRLTSTKSRLQYTAGKQDMTSQFTCLVKHVTGSDQLTAPVSFSIHYPTENVTLQVVPASPLKEGDNLTLTCQADGNPPPTSFNFHLKDKKVAVTGSNKYNLPGVTRADSGEYKCSLPNNDKIEDKKTVTVTYLDLSLSPSGAVVRMVGDSLEVKVDKNSSSEPTVTWTKDNGKLVKQPDLSKLTYSHAGLYVCELSVAGVKRSASFRLTVEGTPVIKSLTKKRSTDGKNKVVTCEAEGSPKPDVQWNVNGTDSVSTYVNGKAIYKLTVVPTMNLTVTCRVTNNLGSDSMTINVSSLPTLILRTDLPEDEDKAKLIVGVVVGLIVIATVVGIIYWLYMKRRAPQKSSLHPAVKTNTVTCLSDKAAGRLARRRRAPQRRARSSRRTATGKTFRAQHTEKVRLKVIAGMSKEKQKRGLATLNVLYNTTTCPSSDLYRLIGLRPLRDAPIQLFQFRYQHRYPTRSDTIFE